MLYRFMFSWLVSKVYFPTGKLEGIFAISANRQDLEYETHGG